MDEPVNETNAERIRKMTDEELAFMLAGQCAFCAYQLRTSGCSGKDCQEGVLEWLKRKYKDGGLIRALSLFV